MPFARLLDRSLLLVKGETAVAFLQNLVTSDVEAIGEHEVRPSALLTPQGKILFDFLLGRIDGGIRIDVASIARADLLKRLTLYRLRAPIAFETPDVAVFAAWGESVGLTDQRFVEGTVSRSYGDAPAGVEERPEAEFDALRIRAGIAEAERDFPASDVFPHDVLLDPNSGVAFKKGCYVGQEVVSRMKHRGTARRRPVLVLGAVAATGTPVLAGGREAGTIGQVVDGSAVAVLRLDRITDPAAVTVDGRPVTVTLPAWATYQFGETTPDE